MAASWVFSGFGGVGPAGAAGGAVDVMRLRFGDKLRRASKTLDELQQDIFNEVRPGTATSTHAWKMIVGVLPIAYANISRGLAYPGRYEGWMDVQGNLDSVDPLGSGMVVHVACARSIDSKVGEKNRYSCRRLRPGRSITS